MNNPDDRQEIKQVRRRMRMARAHRSRTARRSRLGLHKGGPVKYLAKGSEDDFKDVEMSRVQRLGADYTALDWALDIARNMSTYAASKFLHAFGASPKTGGKVFGVDLKEQAELMRKQPGGLLNPRALERTKVTQRRRGQKTMQEEFGMEFIMGNVDAFLPTGMFKGAGLATALNRGSRSTRLPLELLRSRRGGAGQALASRGRSYSGPYEEWLDRMQEQGRKNIPSRRSILRQAYAKQYLKKQPSLVEKAQGIGSLNPTNDPRVSEQLKRMQGSSQRPLTSAVNKVEADVIDKLAKDIEKSIEFPSVGTQRIGPAAPKEVAEASLLEARKSRESTRWPLLTGTPSWLSLIHI